MDGEWDSEHDGFRETKTDSLMDKPPEAELPAWSNAEIMPLIIIENSLVVDKPKTTDGLLAIGSEILLPRSPEMASFEDQDALSAPLSPNRVRKGHSQDMPAEGSIFDVSPDLPGFNMRPVGGGLQPPEITQPPQPTTRSSEHRLRLLNAAGPREWIPR